MVQLAESPKRLSSADLTIIGHIPEQITELEQQKPTFIVEPEGKRITFGEKFLRFNKNANFSWEIITLYTRKNDGEFTSMGIAMELKQPSLANRVSTAIAHINKQFVKYFDLPEDFKVISRAKKEATYSSNVNFIAAEPSNDKNEKEETWFIDDSDTYSEIPQKKEATGPKIQIDNIKPGVYEIYLQFRNGNIFKPREPLQINEDEKTLLEALCNIKTKNQFDSVYGLAHKQLGGTSIETQKEFAQRVLSLGQKLRRLGHETYIEEQNIEGEGIQLLCGIRIEKIETEREMPDILDPIFQDAKIVGKGPIHQKKRTRKY